MIIKKWIQVYNHLEEILMVIMLAVMVVIMMAQVIMRYAVGHSFTWADEFIRLVFMWATWMGISIGQRKGEHIKISMLTDKLPHKAAHITNIVASSCTIAICVFTVYYTVIVVFSAANATYASLGISLVWGYLAIIIGCALMTIRTIVSIVHSFKALSGKLESLEVKS